MVRWLEGSFDCENVLQQWSGLHEVKFKERSHGVNESHNDAKKPTSCIHIAFTKLVDVEHLRGSRASHGEMSGRLSFGGRLSALTAAAARAVVSRPIVSEKMLRYSCYIFSLVFHIPRACAAVVGISKVVGVATTYQRTCLLHSTIAVHLLRLNSGHVHHRRSCQHDYESCSDLTSSHNTTYGLNIATPAAKIAT